MTYRFKLQEPIALGVRCVGIEQLDIAAARLGSKDDIPAAIHDARRCLDLISKQWDDALARLRHLVEDGTFKRGSAVRMSRTTV